MESQHPRPTYSRKKLVGKLTTGFIGWAVELVSIPVKFVGAAVIICGRVLSAATAGGKAELRDADSAYHVLLNLLLITSFCWSGYQYGQLAASNVDQLAFISGPRAAFAVGLGLSSLTQLIQARALRQNSPQKAYAKFSETQNRRLDEEQLEDLIDLAQANGKRYNSAGMFKLRMFGMFAMAAWATEGIVQGMAADWSTPWFQLQNAGVLAGVVVLTFLFELLAAMDEEN